MKPVALLACGAISALGSGRAAWTVGSPGARPHSAIARDEELERAGLKKPFAARVRDLSPGDGDRAARLLGAAARDLAAELDRRLGDWRTRRVAWVIGTSGGGMPSLTDAFARLDRSEPLTAELARRAPYFGPLAVLERALGLQPVERVQVLAACASSTIALGLGARWIEHDVADLVIAGGYDALSPFIAAGFEALGATTEHSNPFRAERDGMALGEGAALLALVPAELAPAEPIGWLLGFSAASDAVHVTAPDRDGTGLSRAAEGALADAGGPPIDLVSAHGTATPYNDAAEARAVDRALGEGARRAVIHPFKAVIGHTLGAAGALELLAALDAIGSGTLPGSVGSGALAPELHARLLDTNAEGTLAVCLKLSAAFGGANAALVASGTALRAPERAAQSVALEAVGDPVLAPDPELVARTTGYDPGKLTRMDGLSSLAVTAVARLLADRAPVPDGTGIVVGSVAATVELDDAFDRRCRQRGHRFAEPRRFPPTSPNLAGGQCSIVFGLRGPSLAVGAGPEAPLEALLVAHDLVRAGDAPAMVVVAVDQPGPAVSAIWSAAGWPPPVEGAAAVLIGRGPGQGLERPEVRRRLAEARSAGGSWRGTPPGWPVLRAGVGA
jgi:3-oxoacyl-[acyl-carrier-protein] synthase-1/3-oxoacyl-[acyl-carrier-protein] synthase II